LYKPSEFSKRYSLQSQIPEITRSVNYIIIKDFYVSIKKKKKLNGSTPGRKPQYCDVRTLIF